MFWIRCAVVDSLEHIFSKILETSTTKRCNVGNEGYCSEGGLNISASPYTLFKEPMRGVALNIFEKERIFGDHTVPIGSVLF